MKCWAWGCTSPPTRWRYHEAAPDGKSYACEDHAWHPGGYHVL